MPGKVGKPTKFNPEVEEQIVEMVKLGNYLETAAAAAGIHRDTLFSWMKTKPTFSEKIQRAQAVAETRDVELIAMAAKKQWPAAAWRLERKNPRRWGPRIQISVQEELDAFLDHLEATLDAPDFEKVLAATTAYDGRGEARALTQGEDATDVGPGVDPATP